jgi:hypothetical protein
MSDDKDKIGSPDRSLINMSQKHEVAYWTKKFGVSEEKLRDAVKRVGHSAAAVEQELKKAS